MVSVLNLDLEDRDRLLAINVITYFTSLCQKHIMNGVENNIILFKNDAYLANWPSSLITIAGETIFISSRKEGTLSRISFLKSMRLSSSSMNSK